MDREHTSDENDDCIVGCPRCQRVGERERKWHDATPQDLFEYILNREDDIALLSTELSFERVTVAELRMANFKLHDDLWHALNSERQLRDMLNEQITRTNKLEAELIALRHIRRIR